MVDWSPGADHVNYLKAAANSRVVGAVTAGLLEALRDVKDLDLAHLHLVGHSLGAHICGYVGRRLKGIGRITGRGVCFVGDTTCIYSNICNNLMTFFDRVGPGWALF